MRTFVRYFIIFILVIAASCVSNQTYAQDPQLESVQVFLTEQGYELGKADGFMGPKTKAAIESFQQEKGLNITGDVDPTTLVAIQEMIQIAQAPKVDEIAKKDEIPDSSSSPLMWLLLGALITFLLIKIFGRKTHAPNVENNLSDQEITKRHQAKNREKPHKKKGHYIAKKNEEVLSKLRAGKATSRTSSDKSSFEGTDELASFRIEFSTPSSSRSGDIDDSYGFNRFSSMGRRPTVTEIKNESNKCWVPKGNMIKISGIEISLGMIYVGPKLRSQKYGGVDNCLINPKLKVASKSNSYDAENIGYWPSYEGLNPKARREYLKWLASGAKDPDANISFAFLYFYGLERRLFLDKSQDEAKAILSEMKRLKKVYPNNHSLERYIENALSFATLFDSVPTSIPTIEIPKASRWELPLSVALYLGNKLKSGETLNNDDALLWFLNHPEKHLRTPANRLEDEFISLLKVKLADAQPNGPIVRMPKGEFAPEYSSCSSTFSTKFKEYTKGMPDISRIKAPVNTVQKLAYEAMDELDKLSRLLGRNPDAKGTFKALSLLPPQLISDFGGKKINEVKTWISGQLKNESSIFAFQEVVRKTTDSDGKKITKAIHRDVDALLKSLGWSMVPSPNETIGKMKPESKVLISQTASSVIAEDKPSEDYLLAFLEISLGAYIAHADDRLLEVELGVLVQKIKKLTHLTIDERSRLYEVIKWLSIEVTDFGAINRKLKLISRKEKMAFAELAIAVAVADGKIEPGEVRALETVYKTLGFDQKDLYSGLHSLGASKPQYIETTPSNDQNLPVSSKGVNKAVELDMNRVQNTLADTKKASALLASIFEDEEPVAAQEVLTDDDDEKDGDASQKFMGLDSAHAQLLTELLESNSWPRGDFMRLASSLNLLPDGAMEVINEWAFETYDEPILEDGEPIEVYADLLEVE
jgi:tellurite resistance protein